ncbi:uncharacterized mitochondrial protein AtMg00810-like [Cucumis melo]|uniref:Uncharacterized mitochondrial protein AtMg00810-like n=1 Tax=Cucumis melo TaxID=3656 RepID=A0ABM3L930_CUCME|nr:uncharacterized mitochondrial protein AtMg00810-like [Cucumis melo]
MVGELTFFLGFQIQQCASGIFLSQGKYARTLITKFELNKAKSKRISAALHLKLLKDDSGEKIDEGLYRSIIGSLLYFTTSRPDIGFAVGVYARYQASPRVSHLHSAKYILKYVLGTVDYGLWYTYDTSLLLVGYCDAN